MINYSLVQIVYPDKYPFISGIISFGLVVFGLLGLIMLILALKHRTSLSKKQSVFIISLSTIILVFVLYNWLGYYLIFWENEKIIIGEYKSTTTGAILAVKRNHTWEIKKSTNSCRIGVWKFHMDEDFTYWNLTSDNVRCNEQTFSSTQITLRGITFKK